MTDEGYLLLATGSAKYFETARNLAASLRIRDGTRPICLVHDGNVWLDAAGARHLDASAVLTDDPPYPGFMNKTYLFPTSPYRRAMFLDADCLLLKRDIDVYWVMTQPHPFAITGGRRARRMEGGRRRPPPAARGCALPRPNELRCVLLRQQPQSGKLFRRVEQFRCGAVARPKPPICNTVKLE